MNDPRRPDLSTQKLRVSTLLFMPFWVETSDLAARVDPMSDGISGTLSAVAILPFLVLGYGFYDTYASEVVPDEQVNLRASVAHWGKLYFDSMHPYIDRIDKGGVFIMIAWDEPVGRKVVGVTVSGKATLDGRTVGEFNGECQRAGSTDLRSHDVPVNSMSDKINNDPVCFMWIGASLAHEKDPATGRPISAKERERVRREIERIKLQDLNMTARVSNRPMRYVSWTMETASKFWDWLSYPFARTT